MAKRGRKPKQLKTTLPEAPQGQPAVKLTLDCNNTQYQSSGETILTALTNLPLSYVEVKTKGTLTITDEKRTASKFYNLPQLRKLVANKMWKIIQANYLRTLLK